MEGLQNQRRQQGERGDKHYNAAAPPAARRGQIERRKEVRVRSCGDFLVRHAWPPGWPCPARTRREPSPDPHCPPVRSHAERSLVELDLALAADLVGYLLPGCGNAVGPLLSSHLAGEHLGQFVLGD